jgi:outer membrane protein assembly factor BamB
VVLISDSGNLKAFSARGNALWNYYARGRLSPFVTRTPEGISYICRSNGLLIAVNRVGRELWSLSLGAPLAAPVVNGWDGRFFAATAKKVSCYNAAGRLLWYRNLEVPLAIGPKADKQGGIFLVLGNGEVLCLNAFGKSRSRQLSAVPALAEDMAGEILVLYQNGDAEFAGGEKYPALLPAAPAGLISRGRQAAIFLKNGNVALFSFEAAEGGESPRLLWMERSAITPSESGNGGDVAAMLYDERGIYVLSLAGAAGFSEEGKRFWFMRILGATAAPVFSEDGLLYSGGNDWFLYAYRLENRLLPEKPASGEYGLKNALRRAFIRYNETEIRSSLSRIEQAISGGRVGEQERSFTAFLIDLAKVPKRGSSPVDLRYRVAALRLLSYLGSGELVSFLTDVFIRDPEPVVKAAAAEAIGRIGLDRGHLAFPAFSLAISPGSLESAASDPQVLLAMVSAIGSLCRFSGPPLSGEGIRLLVSLAGANRPVKVRNRAIEELDRLLSSALSYSTDGA